MEIVIAIVGSIVAKAVEYTISPIKNHVKYLSNHQQYVETLKDRAERLKGARDRVQYSVDAAKRNGEEIEGDVGEWLSAVDKMILEQVEKVMQDEERAKKKCFIGLCPNFRTRYKLSLKAEEEAKAVAELLEHGEFERVSYRATLQGIVVAQVKGYEEFESRTSILNRIMGALKDDSISIVGVHGTGGIGKTTLVKEIARKVKGKLFDSVVIVTVTQAIDIKRIQNEIADFLGLKFEEQSMVGKAIRLRQRLKKEERVLVVLDDIWGKVDIEEVGIPLGDEHKGCKLLLTSRELNVLSNEMDAQENFPIGFLKEKEAWDLFKKMAGNCDESCDLKPIAMKVAKKCAGLPIAIATVAGALRNKRLFEWKNALRELERPSSSNFKGITAAYSAIELSFKYLESEEVKLTFLLCSVIGHNGLVEDLVRYTLGLGLFDGVHTMEEARNKVLTVVANLKASALLLESYNDERFGIHDVVWDAAIAIALKDYRMIVLRDHAPKEWSDKEKMKTWSVISLRCPQIIANLPKEMECSGLSFFHMAYDGEVKIPLNFFKQTEGLKALDLVGMQFPSLPESIIHLADLRMLCIKELPKEMAQLTQLRLLDLRGCRELKIIPPNVLSGCGKLEHLLSPSLARSLVQLQCFEIVGCNCLRDIILAEEIEEERKDVICFHRLNSLRISRLPNLIFFKSGNHNIEFPLLKELKIEHCPKLIEFISQNSNQSGMHALFSEKVAVPSLEDMNISDLSNVRMIFYNDLAPKDLPQLEHLHIADCGVEEIVSKGDGVEEQPVRFEFPQVSYLRVTGVEKLKCFYEGQHTIVWPMLKKLRTDSTSALLKIVASEHLRLIQGNEQPVLLGEEVIPKLEELELRNFGDMDQFPPDLFQHIKVFALSGGSPFSLFPFVRRFYNLERLEFSYFDFKHVVPCKGDAGTLPPIRNLKLFSATNLNHIWRKDSELDHILSNLQTLTVQHCDDWINIRVFSSSLQNLTILNVSFCKMMTNLVTPSVLKNLVQLTTIKVEDCTKMTEIVGNEGDCHQTIVVSKLKCLQLCNLKSLTSFCPRYYNFEFPCLEELVVEDCPWLKIFSEGVLSTPQLQRIKQSRYGEKWSWTSDLNTTIQQLYTEKGGLHGPRDFNISDTSPESIEIWTRNPQEVLGFKNLSSLQFYKCSSLKYIFTPSMLLSLNPLGSIEVKECSSMEQVVREEEEAMTHKFTFLALYSITIESCSNLINFHWGSQALEFPRLSAIKIAECPKMIAFSSSVSRECGDASENLVGEGGIYDNTATLFSNKVVIPSLNSLDLSSINIHKIWHHSSSPSMGYLNFLKVKRCHNLKYLFPSFLAKDLVQLRSLRISDCNMMEQVIFTDGLVEDLPKLTSLCFENYFEFRCLESLSLRNCPLLKTFISKCVPGDKPQIGQHVRASNLEVHNSSLLNEKVVFPSLKNLWIQNCDSLEEIIELQGLIADESQSTSAAQSIVAETVTTKFVFPKLIKLGLDKVPRLKSFYSRMHTTQWPSLKQMSIIECPKVQIFTRQCPVSQVGISNQQPLFCVNEDTFPVLEKLTLKTNDMVKGICDGQLSLQCFQNLKHLNLQFFPETSTTLPYSFIRSLPMLHKLVIDNASICQIVQSEGLSDQERHTSAFYQLKELRLSQLPELTLKTFEPSLLSFKNLTTLEVSRCHGFINLIACLTAKSLTLLERLSIDDCEMMEEIIACEAEEIQGGIVFPKLKYLQLSCLPRLASFSLAHLSLEFPVLLMVKVTKCPKMRNFCQGDLSTPRLEQMHLTRDEEGELQWEGDLNTTIKHMFDEMNVQNSEVTEVTDQLPKLE
ncbi:hypothetical protein GOBAR_DD36483 [Gossypium barbadense]|nr:hypothetical protein GOBAR_DD36483 [Gossypium barbadense]